LAICYFNGSDFPTLKTIRVNGTVFPNGMAYDRGKFYVAVNGTDIDGNDASGIWTYSQFGGDDTPVLSYEFPCGKVGAIYVGEITKAYDSTEHAIVFSGETSEYAKIINSNVQSSGYVETQKYEITPNQHPQLVRGAQANFRATLPTNSSVDFSFRGDEETSYATLGSVTSANQSEMLYGMGIRYRKIQVKITLNSDGSTGTPKLIKANIF
jgi:hypothetical protein